MEPKVYAMFFGGIGTTELLLIVAIITLLFGAKKIPELAKGMGKGISEFKQGMRGEEELSKKRQKDATEHNAHNN